MNGTTEMENVTDVATVEENEETHLLTKEGVKALFCPTKEEFSSVPGIEEIEDGSQFGICPRRAFLPWWTIQFLFKANGQKPLDRDVIEYLVRPDEVVRCVFTQKLFLSMRWLNITAENRKEITVTMGNHPEMTLIDTLECLNPEKFGQHWDLDPKLSEIFGGKKILSTSGPRYYWFQPKGSDQMVDFFSVKGNLNVMKEVMEVLRKEYTKIIQAGNGRTKLVTDLVFKAREHAKRLVKDYIKFRYQVVAGFTHVTASERAERVTSRVQSQRAEESAFASALASAVEVEDWSPSKETGRRWNKKTGKR